MAGHLVKLDETELALEGPQRTTFHITLRRGGEQKVLGGAQILLGATCIGLGMILALTPQQRFLDYDHHDHHYNRAFHNGVPFWMGSLFILSGTFSVVGARHGGGWVRLATFLNLGSVVAGSVAFTLGLTDLGSLNSEPCRQSWGPTNRDEEQEWAMQCNFAFWPLVRMWSGIQLLLLILHVAALATALFCFGYGLRRLCCSRWGDGQDSVAEMDPDNAPVPEKRDKEQSPV